MTTRARWAILVAAVAVAGVGAAADQRPSPAVLQRQATRLVTYAEARPILERLAPELAAAFAARPSAEQDSAWLEWVARRDSGIRARLEQGEEDSVVNLLLFGTSFTRLPRALNDSSSLGGAQRAAEIVRGRIADLVSGIASPGANERLRFTRELVERHGIDPTTVPGREQLRSYILALMKRNVGEVEAYVRTLESARRQGRGELAARSTLYRTRGLSTDTSIRPDFAIARTLDALRARGLLGTGSVRRVAVIGPGLDFTDKAEGYDFYPQQSTQPFSVIDSLLTLRLAEPNRLTLTTIDLSPRVISHLRAAQRRAADGSAYVLVLPRERDGGWAPELLQFWKATGSSIGDEAPAVAAPPSVEVRAVRVRPAVVTSLQIRDVNVVLERLDPLPDDERFDLVIATNVLVYYDVLDQSLALASIAGLLRPGGFLLSNNVLVELPTTAIRSVGHTDAIYSDRPDDRDQVVWYRRP
jgi:SAM-dependent methyltransferase